MKSIKTVLDPCCSSRMFWFEKNLDFVLYGDVRSVPERIVGHGRNARKFKVEPEIVMSFKNMPIDSDSMDLIVFDPPHLVDAGQNGYMAIKYGSLKKDSWKEDIQKGFSECFRVLKPNGVLVFKWNESDIKLKEILKLSPYKPMLGHPSGKRQMTHWVLFYKRNELLKTEKSNP